MRKRDSLETDKEKTEKAEIDTGGWGDENYMRRAIELAEQGCGAVNPNPLVGAVIVKDGRIIAEGYHARYGELHAERAALAACRESAEGATIYVTLEPCCHHGKQPPCTDAILEAGIARVVMGAGDPNPLVAGKGIRILREHGVEVTEGILEEECRRQNRVFFHYIRTGLPYVVLKYAMTMDGKIATVTGASKWITGEEARRRVHEDRNRYTAIMAGSGTVKADDPQLTCRIPGGRNPVRILCDSRLSISPKAQAVVTADKVRTILATCCGDEERQRPYRKAGCEILLLGEKEGHLNLQELMERLGALGIDSVLLEGGGILNWSALKSGVVNRVQAYVAPKIFGGETAPSPIRGAGVSVPADAVMLSEATVTRLGEDLLLESEVKGCLQES